jgi:hypothetical protein
MRLHRSALLAALLTIAAVATALPAWAGEVVFSDGADDAYRVPGSPSSPPSTQPPNAILSDPAADILTAGFANIATSKGSATQRSYSVTMTIKGKPDPSYSYVVAGAFGPDCQLYHPLTPGTTSRARAFCGSGETRRFIGDLTGSNVVLNGNTLTATITFMAKRLPAELSADTTLGPLFAYTCVSGLEGSGCRPEETLDFAQDSLATFTI